MKIEILASARQDLVEGYRFYERQERGLDNYFLDSLFSDIDSLQIHAGVHAIHFGHYHHLLSKRFPLPFTTAFMTRLPASNAVLDCRRNPAWVRKRLT